MIYNLIILVFALIYLPIYLCKRKFHPDFKMRLGILPPGLELHSPIWIHAVSVGEVMAVRNLIKDLRIAYPEKRFFITTVTPTGNRIAKGIASETDFVSYLPLDFSFVVRRVVDKIKPELFIILETEIWPNLLAYLYRKNIPVILVNARISDRSFRGYLSIKFLLRPLLNKIDLFCVQTQGDAQRLMRLGVVKNRIEITGNMKFDIADDTNLKPDAADFRLKLGLQAQERLLVCGSTHPGEEEIILDVYKKLLAEFPGLKLLIAPRHPERATQIEQMVSGLGFQPVLVSQLPLKSRNVRAVFILDTIGQLVYFYRLADIVFVGGSLIKKGGHNILEPASLGKPIICGPHMFNFRDIAGLFWENKAAVFIRNKEELEINIRDLLNNPYRMDELGQRARALLSQNQGATARNLGYISNYISTKEGG